MTVESLESFSQTNAAAARLCTQNAEPAQNFPLQNSYHHLLQILSSLLTTSKSRVVLVQFPVIYLRTLRRSGSVRCLVSAW